VTIAPRLDCVQTDPANAALRIAVFGYERALNVPPTDLPVGTNNALIVNGSAVGNAGQPTTFAAGLHLNTFAFRYDPASETITWSVNGAEISPNGSSPVCCGAIGLAVQGSTGAQIEGARDGDDDQVAATP
jgi:hypothetical protein